MISSLLGHKRLKTACARRQVRFNLWMTATTTIENGKYERKYRHTSPIVDKCIERRFELAIIS